MARESASEVHRFYCTKCGGAGIPIMRPKDRKRPKRHLKKLYCTTCRKDTNHIELSPTGTYTYEDFLNDFKKERFR